MIQEGIWAPGHQSSTCYYLGSDRLGGVLGAVLGGSMSQGAQAPNLRTFGLGSRSWDPPKNIQGALVDGMSKIWGLQKTHPGKVQVIRLRVQVIRRIRALPGRSLQFFLKDQRSQ